MLVLFSSSWLMAAAEEAEPYTKAQTVAFHKQITEIKKADFSRRSEEI